MLVSVVAPCRNERAHIGAFLRCISRQGLPKDTEVEILIVDGESNDGTREILETYQKAHPEVQILDNPKRIVSTGLNAAIQKARGEIIIRMDVHTLYAPDYIAQCTRTLSASGAANVGGPARTLGQASIQRAISIAYRSPFFVGGAKFHNPAYEGGVDTVPYGCWRRQTLLDAGLFDEDLVRSQDAELNFRLRKQGGKIWQSPKIRSWYKPRSSFRELSRQYGRYGYWKFRIIRKHHAVPSVRQLVPGPCLLILLLLLLASPFHSLAARLLVTAILAYALANTAASAAACRTVNCWALLPVVPWVFVTVHVSWAFGFLAGVFDFAKGLRVHGRTPLQGRLTRTVTR